MKKIFMLMIVLFLWAGSSWAQNTVTIGTGTSITTGSTSTITPYKNYWMDGQDQILFTAAELSAAGLGSGNITALAFNVGGIPNTATLNQFTISVQQIAGTTLSGFITSAWTQCYTGNVVAVAGWNTYNFSTPFNWNGTSSLVFKVCFNNSGYTSNSHVYYTTTPSTGVHYYEYGDYATTSGCDVTNNDGTTARPNVRITGQFPTSPLLQVNPVSNAFGYTAVGGSLLSQYILSGANLTAGPIVVTAPSAEFTVSTDNLNWYPSVSISYTPPTLGNTIIYTKFSPSAPNTNYSGNITNVGGGASVNVAVSGSSDLFSLYCPSAAASTGDEDITNVTFGTTLNNTSACASLTGSQGTATGTADLYSNFTSITPTDVAQGLTVPISVQITECAGSAYTHDVRVYIDFNQNGLLTDAGEEFIIWAYASSNTHTINANIAIPVGATLGNTLMRIVCKESSTTGPCLVSSWGETEDYKINIIAAPTCLPVANLTATGIDGFNATLGWAEQGTATNWEVEWGTNGFTQGTGTIIYVNTTPTTTLNGLAPVTAYAFYVRADCGGGTYSTWTGPKTFSTTVACPAPTTLTATPISPNSQNVGWTDATGTLWNIEYGLNGFALGGGTQVLGVTSNPYPLTGLTSATAYQFYVQRDCGGNGVSTWSGPFGFTTLCDAFPTPYNEGFATTILPVCWTNTGWSIGSLRGATGNPGNNIYKNLYSFATTGTFVTGAIGPVSAGMALSFDYKLSDYSSPYAPPANGSGNYVVSVSTDGGLSYTDIETVVNNGTAGWQAKSYLLTAYAGLNINIKIVGNWISGDYDLAFDNIKVETPPTCVSPTGAFSNGITDVGANLNWGFVPDSFFDIFCDISGAPAPGPGTTPTVDNVTGTALTWTGGVPATAYQWYVRADCDAGGGSGVSSWAGPYSFTTLLCNPSSQCNYTFRMTDSYGDGWNGNTMAIKQNGITVATIGSTFTSGSGPVDVIVPLCDGVGFELYWNTGGSYPDEVGIRIMSPWGGTVFYRAPGTSGQGTSLYTGTVVCAQPAPTAFNVTGGGSFCQGGAGFPVGLDNSEIGVTYELLLDGISLIPAVTLPGTEAALNFGTQLVGGVYTIVGVNPTATITMAGNATIVVNPLPLAPVTLTPNEVICANQLPWTLIDVVDPGMQVFWFDAATGGTQLAANSPTYQATMGGTFWNQTFDPITGCWSLLRTPSVLTVNPNPPAPTTLTPNVTACITELPYELIDVVDPGMEVNWYDAAVGGNLLIANSPTYMASAAGTFWNETYDPITGCYSITRTPSVLTVNNQVTPVFPLTFGPYSQGDVAPALPLTSSNGISGTWNPAVVNTSALGSFVYTFTPNAGQCAVVITRTITITAAVPSFTFTQDIGTTLQIACPQIPLATLYYIKYATNPAGPWLTKAANSSVVKIINLSPGMLYYWKAEAYNAAGYKIGTVPQTEYTTATLALDITQDVGNTCLLGWNDYSTWASSYVLYYKIGAGSFVPLTSTINEKKLNGLTPGVPIEVKVAVYKAGVLWGITGIEPFTTNPVVFTPTNITSTDLTLTWNNFANDLASWVTYSVVYYRPQGSTDPWAYKAIHTSANTTELTGLTPGTTYDCYVIPYYQTPYIIWGPTNNGTFTTAGAKQSNSNSEVSVYPNPFVNEIHVALFAETATDVNWSIYDMTGKVVLSGSESMTSGYSTLNIEAANLPKGVYMLNAMINDEMQSFRIMKQ